MLKPIPRRILQTTAIVEVCRAIDRYHNQVYDTYTVKHTHLQPSNEVRKSTADTDLVLTGILFVDARISSPALDWAGLLKLSTDNGGDMRVTVRGRTYVVKTAEGLRDDTDRLHHYEIGLV